MIAKIKKICIFFRGESDNNSTTLEEDVSRSLDLGNSSGEETNSGAAFSSAGEGDAGTIKRKKNKAARKQPQHVPTAAEERRMSIEAATAAGNDTADGGKQNIVIDEDVDAGGGSSRLSPTSSINSQQSLPAVKSQRNDGSTVVSAAKAGSSSQDGGSSKTTTPSTSPPPVAGPVRKHKSRDSGFVGSNDDLLRNEGVTSSDDTQGSIFRIYSNYSEFKKMTLSTRTNFFLQIVIIIHSSILPLFSYAFFSFLCFIYPQTQTKIMYLFRIWDEV